jgi:hypothetical protein
MEQLVTTFSLASARPCVGRPLTSVAKSKQTTARGFRKSLDRYVAVMQSHGLHADVLCLLGTEVVDEVKKLAEQVVEHFPSSGVFIRQLVFPK